MAMKQPSIYTIEINEENPEKFAVTLYWEEVPKATAYAIEIRNIKSDKEEDWSLVIDSLTGTIVKKKNLDVAEKYHFRVRAKVNDEWQSEWSAPSINVAAPGANPLVTSILNGSDALLRGNGSSGYKEVNSLTVAGKVVFLYFSAHWCPPCRQFTPMLIAFYKQMKDLGKPLEVIFVSLDKSSKEFKGYFKSMPWLAVDYDSGITQDIAMRFQVSGIPSLKVISPSGKLIESDGTRYPLNEKTLEMYIRSSQS